VNRIGFDRWLRATQLSGWQELLIGFGALAIPTGIRAAADGNITGCEFTPYLPFVLLAAMALNWWQAGTVAIGAVAILGGLFAGPAFYPRDMECFIPAAGIFLVSSAMIIAIAISIKLALALLLTRGSSEGSGVIFSLEGGQVWASWHGEGPPVVLGSKERVSEMMKDFLAQVEVGKRLARYRPDGGQMPVPSER